MQPNRPLEVVFLTNFSNSSYRAVPAMAQLADELDTRVTILHASEPGGHQESNAEGRLANFFPEADAYRASRRVVYRGHVVDAVNSLSKHQPVDLIVAPSSDPLGLPRLMRKSLRARIIRECGAPVWTMGKAIHSVVLNRRTRNVGCWVDLAAKDTTHISLAFEYASKINAQLHLLHALPEIDEGSLALPLYYDKPLFEEGAVDEIRSLLGWMPVSPEIHVESGHSRNLLPRMARNLNLDIVFTGKEQAVQHGLFSEAISNAVERCVCPVICCDGPTVRMWRLRRGPAFELPLLAASAA